MVGHSTWLKQLVSAAGATPAAETVATAGFATAMHYTMAGP